MEKFSNLILCLEEDENQDPLWQRFYQIQMASFILSSKTMQFEIEEAIRAYELISDKWNELECYFSNTRIPVNNYDNLFKQVLIDFS